MSTTTTTTKTATLSPDSHPVPEGFAIKVSKKFNLIWQDGLHAFYAAVIVPLLLEILTGLQSGNFKPNWIALGTAGVSSAAAYLAKTYFTTTAIVVSK